MAETTTMTTTTTFVEDQEDNHQEPSWDEATIMASNRRKRRRGEDGLPSSTTARAHDGVQGPTGGVVPALVTENERPSSSPSAAAAASVHQHHQRSREVAILLDRLQRENDKLNKMASTFVSRLREAKEESLEDREERDRLEHENNILKRAITVYETRLRTFETMVGRSRAEIDDKGLEGDRPVAMAALGSEQQRNDNDDEGDDDVVVLNISSTSSGDSLPKQQSDAVNSASNDGSPVKAEVPATAEPMLDRKKEHEEQALQRFETSEYPDMVAVTPQETYSFGSSSSDEHRPPSTIVAVSPSTSTANHRHHVISPSSTDNNNNNNNNASSSSAGRNDELVQTENHQLRKHNQYLVDKYHRDMTKLNKLWSDRMERRKQRGAPYHHHHQDGYYTGDNYDGARTIEEQNQRIHHLEMMLEDRDQHVARTLGESHQKFLQEQRKRRAALFHIKTLKKRMYNNSNGKQQQETHPDEPSSAPVAGVETTTRVW